MTRRRNRQSAHLAFKTSEMMLAAPWIAAHRIQRMLASGHAPSSRDRREFARMGTEKVDAFGASWVATMLAVARINQEFTRSAVRAWANPANFWWSSARGAPPWRQAGLFGPSAAQWQRATFRVMTKALAPVHRTAMANARRLSPGG